uniref:(northern house mosquito) hypothetical protein n=1 Tax=Culex pipiens TaxID=7175 RepID=A0A8D8BSN5_CULPI
MKERFSTKARDIVFLLGVEPFFVKRCMYFGRNRSRKISNGLQRQRKQARESEEKPQENAPSFVLLFVKLFLDPFPSDLHTSLKGERTKFYQPRELLKSGFLEICKKDFRATRFCRIFLKYTF